MQARPPGPKPVGKVFWLWDPDLDPDSPQSHPKTQSKAPGRPQHSIRQSTSCDTPSSVPLLSPSRLPSPSETVAPSEPAPSAQSAHEPPSLPSLPHSTIPRLSLVGQRQVDDGNGSVLQPGVRVAKRLWRVQQVARGRLELAKHDEPILGQRCASSSTTSSPDTHPRG